jgi:hypothetical protein
VVHKRSHGHARSTEFEVGDLLHEVLSGDDWTGLA